MTETEKSIVEYREETGLAPAGSLRAALRPHVASAARAAAETMRRAPELADEVVGLVRALREYWQRKADQLDDK